MAGTESLGTLIKEQGLTQSQFAQAVGVSQQLVSLWVRGEKTISPSRAQRVSEVLGVAVAELPVTPEETAKPIVENAPLTTFFAWLLGSATLSKHLGATLDERVWAVADRVGVTRYKVHSWFWGHRLITEAEASKLDVEVWHALGLRWLLALAGELGVEGNEAGAVWASLSDILDTLPKTFAEARGLLDAEAKKFEAMVPVPAPAPEILENLRLSPWLVRSAQAAAQTPKP